mmetsp:Transcript_30296/g.79343  ORF Transcript_30296/g.79343 Transcript_30296/m.79343 type:complete len:358 (-) Transcript_30296:15-1088(-)
MAHTLLPPAILLQVFHVTAVHVLRDPPQGGGLETGVSHYPDPKSWVTNVFSVGNQDDDAIVLEPTSGQRSLADVQKQRGRSQGARLDIIVFGIMRTFQETWPRVQDQLQLSQLEARGVRVDVVVSTTLRVRCTEKDHREGFCAEAWRQWSEDEFKRQIRGTYGSRLKYIFDTSAENLDKVGELLKSDEGSVYTMLKDTGLRLWRGRKPPSSGVTVLLRSDVYFTTAHVDVRAICKSQPGYLFISGWWERPCFWHQRDLDFGAVACSPRALELDFAAPERCEQRWPGCANGADEPPPLPAGFSGSWSDHCGAEALRACGTHECDQVLTFSSRGELLGNLDAREVFLKIRRWNESEAME